MANPPSMYHDLLDFLRVLNSCSSSTGRGYTVVTIFRLAGGATRGGDKRREFVLRANGATVSKQQHSNLIINTFATLGLMPTTPL